MLESYFTIKGDGEHEIVIQKSRFIGHVKRTETVYSSDQEKALSSYA